MKRTLYIFLIGLLFRSRLHFLCRWSHDAKQRWKYGKRRYTSGNRPYPCTQASDYPWYWPRRVEALTRFGSSVLTNSANTSGEGSRKFYCNPTGWLLFLWSENPGSTEESTSCRMCTLDDFNDRDNFGRNETTVTPSFVSASGRMCYWGRVAFNNDNDLEAFRNGGNVTLYRNQAQVRWNTNLPQGMKIWLWHLQPPCMGNPCTI